MVDLEQTEYLLRQFAVAVFSLQRDRAIELGLTLYRIDEQGCVVPVPALEYFGQKKEYAK
jgi:hypothetical protein